MLNIVIPMAGQSSRFKKVGITIPKHEIIANDKSLFEWSILTFEPLFKKAHFTFICHQGHENFIKESLHKLELNNFSIVTLDHPTKGQAETVLLGIERQKLESELLIFNIDTHIKPQINSYDFLDNNYDGWLQLFEAEGSHWSFAKINEDSIVTEVKEKVRISNYASTGMYYFKSSENFKSIYYEFKEEIKAEYNEYYIAPMYEYLLKKDSIVSSSLVDMDNVIPLGTPLEISQFDSNFTY